MLYRHEPWDAPPRQARDVRRAGVTTDSAFARGLDLLAEGRQAIALEQFTVAADDGAADDRLAAMAHAAQLNMTLGRPHEALVWAERLRDEAPTPDQADFLAAQAHTRLGEGETALALLEQVGDPDTKHFTYPAAMRALVRAEALAAAGRTDDAVQAAVAAAEVDASPAVWRALAEWIDRAEGDQAVDVEAAVAGMAEDSLTAVAAGLVDAPVGGATRLVAALWQRWPEDSRLLALMATIGHRLPVASALEWSAKMRAAGQGEHCPLLGIAASSDRHPRERVRAAAAAGQTFDDDRARGLLELSASALADEDIGEAFDEVLTLAPDLADSLVLAVAQTGRRALLVAAALDASGNSEPALAVANHALELTTGQPDVWRAAVRAALDDVGEFADRAETGGHAELAAALREARPT
jgi:tetratricopeptide (TPR) repeat protein